jgi:hypothetical protein
MSLQQSFRAFAVPFAAGIALYLLAVLVSPLAGLFALVAVFLWGRAGRNAHSHYSWSATAAAKYALLPAFIVGLIAGGMEFTKYLLGFGTVAVDAAVAAAANATVDAATSAPVPAGSAESFILGVSAFAFTLVAVTFWASVAAGFGAYTQSRKG